MFKCAVKSVRSFLREEWEQDKKDWREIKAQWREVKRLYKVFKDLLREEKESREEVEHLTKHNTLVTDSRQGVRIDGEWVKWGDK